MPSADRSDSPDDREKDDGRGGNKKSAASKAKDLSHVPCKFYKVGSCTAGSSCPFSHSLVEPGGQKDVCAWFVKGNCKFGHKCALAHVLPGQTMAMDRKNKKAAQIAAGGAKNSDGKGRGGSKRDGGNNARNPLLVGGSTAPTRARPMNMPLKATISPSAPAPPLKDTDFASFGVLDESTQLPTAPARNKSPSPTGTKPPSPTIPVSAPRRPSMSSTSPSKDFGPIGSPPSSATSPSRMHSSGTPPTQANGFLSTSPFSAPGTQSVFLGYGESGRKVMAASLGSGMAMGGGPGGWNANGNHVSSSPLRGSLLSASRMNGRVNGEYDISVEYEELGTKGRRKATLEDSNEDLEDFLPSSLTDLLTPEERSRRMSRTNSGQSPGVGGGFESSSPHRQGLGVPLGHNAGAGGGGHRYSRSVPAPSLLGGDLKSIWAADQGGPPPNPHAHPTASGMPASPMGHGPSSYSSASGFAGRGDFDGTPSSFVDDGLTGMRSIPSLSPSNASAAFLPGIHQYIAQNKQQGARTTSNPTSNLNGMFSSNAAHLQGPPGIAHYLQSGPGAPANALNSNTGSPYVRPNPFDLTQQMHQPPQGAPSIPGAGAGDSHILSPNARALQAHAPGQSLPQGLAAGYSRIHALPPLPPTAGSPSPAAFGASPNTGTAFGGRDWSTMSSGSVSGSPGLSFMPSAAQIANANAANTNTGPAQQGTPKSFVAAASPPPNAGAQGLDAMFSRLSYSAAAARTGGAPAAPAQMQRNPSGGARWQGAAPLSPLSGPVVTGDDDLFPLDE
ncbi:hypothetical protein FB451DRAFT_767886 [Mycena latifolia]|nr:hypothetical protein FB451DRAFT_767886 [Mycena latifolia]